MNQKRNRRTRNDENKKQKKVIRCKALSRPVFEYEVCSKFSSKVNSNNQTSCESCMYAF